MERMNLLVVERDADWSQWASISRGLGRAVLVLVQQADESSPAFHERIARRLQRGKAPPLNKVVVLGSDRGAALPDPVRDRLLEELSENATYGLRVYPHVHAAAVRSTDVGLEYAVG
jgi:hypothetical protein